MPFDKLPSITLRIKTGEDEGGEGEVESGGTVL